MMTRVRFKMMSNRSTKNDDDDDVSFMISLGKNGAEIFAKMKNDRYNDCIVMMRDAIFRL